MKARPIYEWHLIREGHEDHITRSPRNVPYFHRIATKLGGRVERRQVGFRLPFSLAALEAWAEEEAPSEPEAAPAVIAPGTGTGGRLARNEE